MALAATPAAAMSKRAFEPSRNNVDELARLDAARLDADCPCCRAVLERIPAAD